MNLLDDSDDDDCDCPECEYFKALQIQRVGKRKFVAILTHMPFVVGRGSSKRRAAEALLPYWESATGGWN